MDNKLKATFADSIRQAARELAGRGLGAFTLDELAVALKIQTSAKKKKLASTLYDFKRAGEIIGVDRSVYRFSCGAGTPACRPQIRHKMWKILRARKSVTAADLQELAGASKSYAQEWLRMLARREIVKRLSGSPIGRAKYQLIKDSLEPPTDEKKAARLRGLRNKKKRQALEALKRAAADIETARLAIEQMEDETADERR